MSIGLPPDGLAAAAAADTALLFWTRRLSRRAAIFLGAGVPAAPLGSASVVGTRLGNRRAWSLVVPHWTLENDEALATALDAYRRHRAAYPEHRVVFLCATQGEVVRLQGHGVPAMFAHQNMLVRDPVFTIDPQAEKAFDAIYVGKMASYKRHCLAREISRLAVVYYRMDRGAPEYLESVRAALPHAEFVNETWARAQALRLAHPRAQAMARRAVAERGYAILPQEMVSATINRARVGLCLSEEEGAMYASTEYLLCGLPVVTTASRGGRDYFFDPEFTVTVAADPAAVRDGVAALIARAIPPERIRAETLRKLQHERRQFRSFLGALFDAEGVADELDESWTELFTGAVWHWHSAETLLEPRIGPPPVR